MTCCFIRRIKAIEEAGGKCALRFGDWHPVDGTRASCQVSLVMQNNDTEHGIGNNPCEALDALEKEMGLCKPDDCCGCNET